MWYCLFYKRIKNKYSVLGRSQLNFKSQHSWQFGTREGRKYAHTRNTIIFSVNMSYLFSVLHSLCVFSPWL